MSEKPVAKNRSAGSQPSAAAGDSGTDATVEPKVYEHSATSDRPFESGGPAGPEPTRYGDWERKGRCIDF